LLSIAAIAACILHHRRDKNPAPFQNAAAAWDAQMQRADNNLRSCLHGLRFYVSDAHGMREMQHCA
jgi:hypothetical protein